MIFVQSATGGTVRTDGGIWAGFKGVVGWQDLLVSALARWVYSGNSVIHSINILDALGNLLGEVALNAEVEPVGFAFVNLNTSVLLPAGSTFFILSQEPGGAAEIWTNDNLNFVTTEDATVTYSVSTTDTNGVGVPTLVTPKAMFVPVSFQYTIVASTPTTQVMVPT